jgi:C4-dicarboxylate-specific signal transduction histidine kinase
MYRYRLQGYEADWQTTHSGHAEYHHLPRGRYAFEVRAVDRDLTYSEEPAVVRVEVHWPYGQIGWVAGLSLAIALVAYQTGRVFQRDRRLRQANRALMGANQELSTEIRERQRLEVERARLVSLGQMAASVAHELNQPLAAISAVAGGLHLRLVQGRKVSEDQLKDMMQDVLRLVERMGGVMGHLRVFSRDTADDPAILFSVNEAIHSTLKVIGTQLANHGIAVGLELGEGLPLVRGHPYRIEQVLLNLLANARDALDEKPADQGGDKQVRIRTYCETDEAHWVITEVEDNGVGIAEAHLARLFAPFFTTKTADRGTGLGLSISHAIVQNHGGRITCDSRKGEGARFRVALPAAAES